MRFKKVYVEITNNCNFGCSFCFKSDRKKQFMSPEVFSAILFRLQPYTRYLYLHVLGEPFLHPLLPQLLDIAFSMGFEVNITTNGSLLRRFSDLPQLTKVRQFNISIHDAAENIPESQLDAYLDSVFTFSRDHSRNSYVSLRLWNQGVDEVTQFNSYCMDRMQKFFSVDFPDDVLRHRNTQVAPHVFFQNSARFAWPGTLKDSYSDNHSCQALRDHIAVLVDGTVVPCCLDAGANLSLGNILVTDLQEILSSRRAISIQSGFQHHVAVEEVCKHCGFFLAN